MKKTGKCPKCESSNIIPEVQIIAQQPIRPIIEFPHITKARVIRHPHAMIFEEPEQADLKA